MTRLKFTIYPLMFCAVLYGIVVILKFCGFAFVFQESNSMPVGYYFIYPSTKIKIHDIVLVNIPMDITNFLLQRGYLKGKKPLLKEVVATDGDQVCFHDLNVSINKKIYPLFKFDKEGRTLPKIHFCSTLKKDEYFVIGSASQHSFDSRYFGLIQGNQILGKAIKL